MRKELLIAIVLGLFFGLIIGFGIWRANSAIKNDPSATQIEDEALPPQESELEAATTPEIQAKIGSITISKPQEMDVVTESPVKIEGLATADTSLIISGEIKDYVVKTSNTGTFEADVDLGNGVNQIIVQENNESSQPVILTVVYSEDFKQ